jgi:hypothetical protein
MNVINIIQHNIMEYNDHSDRVTPVTIVVEESKNNNDIVKNTRAKNSRTENKFVKDPKNKPPKIKRKSINKSLKNNVWIQYCGKKFDSSCYVTWCKTRITPFTFEVGHDVPHSKNGTIELDNLRPICATCNKSMGNRYTITEWSKIVNPKTTTCSIL